MGKDKELFPNFLECGSIEEANCVDMDEFRFLEDLSAKRGTWNFVKRQRPRV